MRVAINKLTGKMIESQSGGDTQAHLDTLRQNALGSGFKEKDIEVKFVDHAEYIVLKALSVEPPTQQEIRAEKIQNEMLKIAEDSLIAKGEI